MLEFGGGSVVGYPQSLGLPVEFVANPIGDVAEQHRLGKRTGVVEGAGGGCRFAAGLKPLSIVTGRVGGCLGRRPPH